jgi:hypothetical protein
MSYRDEEDDDRRNHPRAPVPDDAYDRDEDFVRAGDKPQAGRDRRARGPLLRILLATVLVIVILGGGLLAAIQFRLVDPAQLGLGGVFGGATGSGGPTGPAVQAEVIFAGDSALLSAAPGNSIQPDQSADIAWLRTTVKAASAAGASDGVSLIIPKALLPRFEGRRVRVTIAARSGTEGAPIPFAAAYSAGPKGNSNWVVFVPEKQFTDHSFSFVVPIGDLAGSDDHRIAIWSDIEGRGAPLGVRSITIRPD